MAGRHPKSEERALWRAAMRGVAPLAKHTGAAGTEPPAGDAPPPKPAKPPRRSVPPPPVAKLPDLAPGVTPGVDRRSAERLRRGERRIDARLDLHGMTQDEAHRPLHAFLAPPPPSGSPPLLVITATALPPT